MSYKYKSTIAAAYKRHLIGSDNISKITNDYTDKLLDDALREIIGHPGKSAGKAGNDVAQNAISNWNNSNPQADYSDSINRIYSNDGSGSGDGGSGVASGVIGLITSLIGMAHADWSAKKAYERQNEFYDNHISMPAKVEEYQEAGLNPMGLAGAGVGATSAPSVDSASTPDLGGITNLLGSILNYKLGKKQLEVEKYKADIQSKNVASEIEYRTTQRLYQEKVNEWFDVNQVASIDKLRADTEKSLQDVKTGQADEALKRAGITKTEAEAGLTIQQMIEKELTNSPEWKQAELDLMRAKGLAERAAAGESQANAQHLYADIGRIKADQYRIYKDAFYKIAQTDVARQELHNLGIQGDILNFTKINQSGQLAWKKYNDLMAGLKDAGIGIGSAAAGIKGIGPVLGTSEPKIAFPSSFTASDGVRGTLDPNNPFGGLKK